LRTCLSQSGPRTAVLVAAALISLMTACGPGDLGGVGGSVTGPAGTLDGTAAGEQMLDDQAASATEAPDQQPAATAPTEGAVETTTTETPTPEAVEVTAEPVIEAQSENPTDSSSPGSADVPVAGGAPAATDTPAGAESTTGGSGGSFADQQRQTFTADNGHSGRYLLYAGGVDPTRPVGLVVYADGTGEYGVDNPDSSYALGGSSGLIAVGRSRNMITLAVESPNQSCECWHTGDTSGYADFLAALIETQLGNYPISDVWLAGFSSGAQEITRFLAPRHPELMRLGGGWVVFGGGGPPAGGTSLTAAQMAGVRGHWYTGTADTAVPLTASWGAQAGESWYANRGVITSHEWPAGVGHGLDGRLGRTVAQLIDE
jgi:hypothetical protein